MTDEPATLDEADEELVSALRTGVMRLSRRLRNERSGTDVTLAQLSALATLYRHGAQTIGELAHAESVRSPSMTRTVSYLERLGLVIRRSNDSDGRQVVVELTAKAMAVLREDRCWRDSWLKFHLAELTDADRSVLRLAAPLLDALAHK